MDVAVVEKLAVAVGLGLLVGFQREWAEPSIAGIRTFALITLFGTLVGLSAESFGGWAIAAGLLSVAALVVTGSVLEGRRAEEPPGLTTEFAALVMYAVGVTIAVGHLAVGVLVGAGTAVLLQWKAPLHRFVDRVGAADVRAIFQLVLIGLVILPVLPRRALDPYGVLVPFEIWLMVVLIVGISLAGYTAARIFGAGVGTLMAGVLGGLISSTATTVSYARGSRRAPGTADLGALVATIASTIVFARVLFEVGVVAPEVLPGVAGPLLAMLAVMTLISAAMWLVGRRHAAPAAVEGGPPVEIKSAIVFGSGARQPALRGSRAVHRRRALGDHGCRRDHLVDRTDDQEGAGRERHRLADDPGGGAVEPCGQGAGGRGARRPPHDREGQRGVRSGDPLRARHSVPVAVIRGAPGRL